MVLPKSPCRQWGKGLPAWASGLRSLQFLTSGLGAAWHGACFLALFAMERVFDDLTNTLLGLCPWGCSLASKDNM